MIHTITQAYFRWGNKDTSWVNVAFVSDDEIVAEVTLEWPGGFLPNKETADWIEMLFLIHKEVSKWELLYLTNELLVPNWLQTNEEGEIVACGHDLTDNEKVMIK